MPSGEKEKRDMKTRKNKERVDISPVFAQVDGIVYLCCNHCGKPMDAKSNLYFWQEDTDGKAYNVHFIHYKCQLPFEIAHHGIWSNKGMLSVKIDFASKEVFLILNEQGTIIRVTKSFYLANKYKPRHGSYREISPAKLAIRFGNDPVVRTFLETYDGGKWLHPMANGE
jgi:hypothetical protein